MDDVVRRHVSAAAAHDRLAALDGRRRALIRLLNAAG
jgi:hypothetical protein